MNRGDRESLALILTEIAAELRSKPDALNDEYDRRLVDPGDHSVDTLTRWPRQVGALEGMAQAAAMRIDAAIDTYLKGKR